MGQNVLFSHQLLDKPLTSIEPLLTAVLHPSKRLVSR